MISCSNCRHSSSDDAKYCPECGNWLGNSARESTKSFFSRIPSWLTAIIVILAAFAFIGFNILLVVGISSFEGIASTVFMAIGILMFIVFPLRRKTTASSGQSILGAVVVFFALMGAVIDQTGNFAYNKPVEWSSCPAGSSLDRKTDVNQMYPGKTFYSQDFTCYDLLGNAVKQINIFWVLLIRFVEYLVLALILIIIQRLIQQLRENRAR